MDSQIQAFEELKRFITKSKKSEATNAFDLNEQNIPDISIQTYPDVIETLSTSNGQLDATTSYSIDGNIQKMRSELQKSCELFQAAGEAFESINFNCLKHRIKDLHLSASHSEMDSVMQEKNVDQSLNKLTDIMGYKFRQHPGEFGDIPELSSFFKACSQLKHGLEQLKQNRSEMDELEKQMSYATNTLAQRADKIQKTIKKKTIN